MVYWQEFVAIVIAFVSALFVLRDFVRPFLNKRSCGTCGGCEGETEPLLEISSVRK